MAWILSDITWDQFSFIFSTHWLTPAGAFPPLVDDQGRRRAFSPLIALSERSQVPDGSKRQSDASRDWWTGDQ